VRCGHLFNGIGGFPLAASWMGWENIFHCEIDDFCNRVMKKHFPESIQHGDIKQQDFSSYRGAIDLLTGGDPCQPHSLQGSKKGKEDSRYLWPEYYRCITECRPGRIVNENVEGSIYNGILDQKIGDLEAIGYACWPPLVIPAGATGALHIRNRIWLVAYSDGWRLDQRGIASIQEYAGARCGLQYSGVSAAEWSKGSHKGELLRMAHGFPRELDRAKRMKGAANAIVPQVAYEIFKAIEAFEQLTP
jgi:DNA (cytosine-5)-methyltransferase 1